MARNDHTNFSRDTLTLRKYFQKIIKQLQIDE